MSSLILKAHQRIAENYSDAEIARLISSGQIDRVVEKAFNDTVLDAAYSPVRERMRRGVTESVSYYAKTELPRPPKGTLEFAFNSLSPNVIEGIRQLDSKVMQGLKDETRETVRAYIENGLRDGVNPTAIAKNIKHVVGLSPYQLGIVDNYRKALEAGNVARAESYKLRDKRLKVTEGMSAEKIDKAVEAYRRKLVRHNSETISRTASLDAQKAAQRLSWEQAASQGIVDRGKLKKTWLGVMDARERDSHVAMEKETVPFDMPFSNGQMVPGDSDYNCRCVAYYSQR